MGHTFRREQTRNGWVCCFALGVCLALGAVAAPVRAQAPAQPADAAREKISLDLVDADLRDAISLIFKDSGLNHVIGDGVYGQGVTLRLDNVPRETALQMLLDPKGFMSVKQNGVYLIKPKPMAPGMMPGGQMGPGGMYGSGMGSQANSGEGAEISGPTSMPITVASSDGGEGGVPGLGSAAGAPTAAARSNIPVKIRLKHMSPLELLAGGPLMGGANQMGGMGGGNMGGYGGYGNNGGYGGGGYGNNGGYGGMGGGMGGGFGGNMGGMGGGFGGNMGGMGGGFGGNMGGFGNLNNNNNNNNRMGGGAMFRPTLRR